MTTRSRSWDIKQARQPGWAQRARVRNREPNSESTNICSVTDVLPLWIASPEFSVCPREAGTLGAKILANALVPPCLEYRKHFSGPAFVDFSDDLLPRATHSELRQEVISNRYH
jgi:hypothetical protein